MSVQKKQEAAKKNIPFDSYFNTPLTSEEPVLNKKIFFILAAIMLISMMFMGYNAGMSGDEVEHYTQAEKVYNYYASGGDDKSALKSEALKLYGQSFDLLTYAFNKWFHVDNIYESRHVMNSVFGWFAILFCALIAVEIAGWTSGILALLLLFFSPGFLGHSFNNPKDITFAMAYIFAIYAMIRFIKKLPKINIKSLVLVFLSTGFAISIRIGGLMLIAYLFLFVGLYCLYAVPFKQLFSKDGMQLIRKLFIFLIATSIAAYILGILFWPFGLEAPMSNPLKALTMMTNFGSSIKQTFEGVQIWSDQVPWYYSSKYILISVPIVVIIGFITSFIYLLIKKQQKINLFLELILLFAIIFPLFYIVYKHSNVFGGWRHVMFVYPPLVSLSAVGFGILHRHIKNKKAVYFFFLILALLFINPVKHIIKNYPYQYVYFNELVGGVKGAYGQYETDYYYNSLKASSEWLIREAKLDTINPKNKIIVATNHGSITGYYFRHLKDKISIKYVRYYERGNTDWDYYVLANSFLGPTQIQAGTWPPKNTIHTIDVDGIPIGVVLKRTDKSDYVGYQAMERNHQDSAIALFKKAISIVPTNEVAYINLIEIYLQQNKFDSALAIANGLLKIYPGFDFAYTYIGLIYFNMNDPHHAELAFNKAIKSNLRNVNAYYYLAYIKYKTGDPNKSIYLLQKAIRINPTFKQAYILLGNIYKEFGNNRAAEYFFNIAKQL